MTTIAAGHSRRRCPVEHCTGASWIARGTDFCGRHVREAATAMKPETDAQAQRIADREIRRMHDTLGAMQRRINELENGAAALREARRADPGVVYYLRVGSYIKIGWTADLTKRMRAYSPDSVLLATEPGTRRDEQQRHRSFAVHRTHGREWYAMTPTVMHHIEQVAAEHGMPDPVTFAAKPVGIPQSRQAQAVKPRGFAWQVS